ncbi:MAG TPA: low molecular weight protein-tyrosine-phosphatase [Usitatibacter sp.]|nr:low molecular weight protein-tyrosine-phosphatase [Usitatibacter sp.]
MSSAVLFVCTANICRSPMAEGALRAMLASAGRREMQVGSVGTHEYHVGMPAFPTAMETAKRRGYDISRHVARQITAGDLDRYDMLLALDRYNLASLRAITPTRHKGKIELLLEYGDAFRGREVPDPYGRDAADFERAMDLIEDGCRGLVKILVR